MITFAVGISEAKAEDDLTLEVVAASCSRTEILVIRSVENEVSWSYVTPLEARTGRGQLVGDASSIREIFELAAEQYNERDQRKRVEARAKSTFSLFLKDSKGLRISMPLTHREQQAVVNSDLMKQVLQGVNAQQLLSKPVPMTDFFYPDRNPDTDSRKPAVPPEKSIREDKTKLGQPWERS